MNIKTILIAVSLIALSASAADVPYTPGVNPGSGVEMTFDGSGNIATLVATPTDSGTITLTGGAATFAAGATITVNAPGTLAFAEKVTANGALTINRGDNAYLVWSSDTALTAEPAQLAFSGVTRDDIELVKAVSTGHSTIADVFGQQGIWNYVEGPNSAGFYVFNKVTAAYVFSARIRLTETGGNLEAACRTGIRSPRFGLYPDEEAEWASRNLFGEWNGKSHHIERGVYAKSDEASGVGGDYMGYPSKLGIRKLIARRKNASGDAMSVRFVGGASFGGATTIGAGMEAVVVATSSNAASISNAISGDGDFRIEASSGNATATLACDMSGLVGGLFSIEGKPNTTLTVTANVGTTFPYGGEVHVNTNSTLVLNRTPGNEDANYWKPSLFVHRGGTMKDTKDWQIMRRQQVVFDGGSYAVGSTSGSIYMNCLTLSGASITGSSYIRSVNESEPQYFRVIGTEPSTISCTYGVTVYGYSTEANARNNSCAFRIDVADVTGNSDVDCTMNRFIVDDGKPWLGFEKYGNGTVKISNKSSKKVRLESKLYAGTLLLGSSDIMTNAVELLGGNLAAAANAVNSLGNLKATTNATLTVGAGGSLSFASFTPGAGLAEKSIVIDAPMKGDFVRFGKNGNGLADGHRKYFRWKDATNETKLWKVEIDGSRYLHPMIKGTLIRLQ